MKLLFTVIKQKGERTQFSFFLRSTDCLLIGFILAMSFLFF